LIYQYPLAKEVDMAIVKPPASNNISAVPSGGITPVNTSCVSNSKHENAHTPTQRQQKALNNFLYGRQSLTCSVKTNIPAQIAANSNFIPRNQPKEY